MVDAHGGKSVSIPPFYTRDGTLSQALLLTFQWSLYLPDPHPLTLLASLLFTLYLDLCRLHMLVCFLNELWNCIRLSSYLLQRLFFLLRTGWRQLLFWLLSELLRLFPFPWKERTTWDECHPCQCLCCVQTEQRWANNYIFKKKKPLMSAQNSNTRGSEAEAAPWGHWNHSSSLYLVNLPRKIMSA